LCVNFVSNNIYIQGGRQSDELCNDETFWDQIAESRLGLVHFELPKVGLGPSF